MSTSSTMISRLGCLAFLFAMVVATLTASAPLEARSPPPTGNLYGQAQWSSFDGVTACGNTVYPNQSVVAISGTLFDNIDGVCGRRIKITSDNGITHYARIQDSCGSGCSKHGLLLTSGLFKKYYGLDKGVFQATWSFV